MAEPSWTQEARSELSKVGKDYNAALKSIALGIAIGERSERVLAPHVHDAFRVLAAAGNARKPWYKRHELEVAVGGTLIGASTAVPDFLSGFFPDDSQWKRVTVCVAMLLMLIIGAFLVIHGILQVNSAIVWTWWPLSKKSTSLASAATCPLPAEPTPIPAETE